MKLPKLDLNPLFVDPVNDIDQARVATLAASLRNVGWIGPEILVEETEHGFVAWTGSHRLAAAKIAGVSVRCLVLGKTEARSAFEATYSRGYHRSWRDAVTDAEGPFDQDRLRALRRVGLEEMADHLAEEVRRQEADRARQLEERLLWLKRTRPANYSDLMQRFDSAHEGDLLTLVMSSSRIVQLIKLNYLDQVDGTKRSGLFDLERYERNSRRLDGLVPVISRNVQSIQRQEEARAVGDPDRDADG